MKIRTIVTDAFRGLPDRDFSFIDERTGSAATIVAITGASASGKTSLLDAIVAAKETIGPYGAMPAASDVVRFDAAASKVAVLWELSRAERDRYGASGPTIPSETIFGDAPVRAPDPDPALAALLSEYDADASTGKVEYFHAERGLSVGSALDLTRNAGDTLDRMARLASDNRKYASLVRFIVEAGLGLDTDMSGQPRAPGRIKQAFESLCRTKKLGGLYRVDGQVLPGFFDLEERVPHGVTQLSASELDLLLFAASFVRAGLIDNAAGSLILIDSPEKHVGESDAGALVAGLSLLGANNQLVVATRARSVLGVAQQVVTLG